MQYFTFPILAPSDAVVVMSPQFRSSDLHTILLTGLQGRLSRVSWREALWHATTRGWELPLTGIIRTPLATLFPIWALVQTTMKSSSLKIPASLVATAYEEYLAFVCSSSPSLTAQEAAAALQISRSAFRQCVLSGRLPGISVPSRVDAPALIAAVEALHEHS